MIEPVKDPSKRLTFSERQQKRMSLMQDVDDYIKETIQYCDDEEELIALGSVLQIISKNILTSVMDRTEWRQAISAYISDVEKEKDFGSIRQKYKDII
jgi:hypothetical protein